LSYLSPNFGFLAPSEFCGKRYSRILKGKNDPRWDIKGNDARPLLTPLPDEPIQLNEGEIIRIAFKAIKISKEDL
jgi:hypothetical protein